MSRGRQPRSRRPRPTAVLRARRSFITTCATLTGRRVTTRKCTTTPCGAFAMPATSWFTPHWAGHHQGRRGAPAPYRRDSKRSDLETRLRADRHGLDQCRSLRPSGEGLPDRRSRLRQHDWHVAVLRPRMRELGVKPELVSWTVPFTRTIEAFLEMGLLMSRSISCSPSPIAAFTVGIPAPFAGFKPISISPAGPQHRVVGIQQDRQSVRPGSAGVRARRQYRRRLGDYAYLELGPTHNVARNPEFARLARGFGREPATPAETRQSAGHGLAEASCRTIYLS